MNDRNRGSATLVEMIFVFPIVICVVVAMLYMGLYFLQISVINSYTQKTAQYLSRLVANPNYEKIVPYTQSNDLSSSSTIAGGALTDNYDMYRFFKSGAGVNYSNVESSLQKFIQTSAFLAAGKVSCDIDISNYFIYQTVKVSIVQDLEVPGFLKYLGMKELKIRTTAQTAATSPADYVRNIDLVYDLVELICDKFNLQLDDVVGKISSFAKK